MHGYQNSLESWLFFADVLIVGFGMGYTALTNFTDAAESETPRALIEGCVILLMAGSLTASAAFLVRVTAM